MIKFILRKPKFMRDDKRMQELIETAERCVKAVDYARDAEEKDYFATYAALFFERAARAGGFLTMNGFIKWFDNQKNYT